MKPAAFDYVRPRTVEEAIASLSSAQGGAKLIAGGQSLGPMLNLRLVQPRFIIDIAGIPELTAVAESRDSISIGAAVTAAAIEDGRIPTERAPMLRRIAGGIAYRAVRNRGTIGGSLCHADPAADWASTLAALGAVCVIAGQGGAERFVKVEDFFVAAFENALADSDVLRAVRVPKVSARARFGYVKFSRKVGKFAIASGVVLFEPEHQVFRAVMGATEGKPILISDARPLFGENPMQRPLRFDAALAGTLLTQNGVSSAAQRQLHLTALRRAAEEAFAQ